MTDDLRLDDREALRELRARYTHTYDGKDLEGFCDLFTEDGVLQLGPVGFAEGRQAIGDTLGLAMLSDNWACHFTTDELTEFTAADTATGTSRFAVHYGRTPNMMGAGTYRDEYRREAGRWRIALRTIDFFYMGEPAVAWPPTPPPLRR